MLCPRRVTFGLEHELQPVDALRAGWPRPAPAAIPDTTARRPSTGPPSRPARSRAPPRCRCAANGSARPQQAPHRLEPQARPAAGDPHPATPLGMLDIAPDGLLPDCESHSGCDHPVPPRGDLLVVPQGLLACALGGRPSHTGITPLTAPPRASVWIVEQPLLIAASLIAEAVNRRRSVFDDGSRVSASAEAPAVDPSEPLSLCHSRPPLTGRPHRPRLVPRGDNLGGVR